MDQQLHSEPFPRVSLVIPELCCVFCGGVKMDQTSVGVVTAALPDENAHFGIKQQKQMFSVRLALYRAR